MSIVTAPHSSPASPSSRYELLMLLASGGMATVYIGMQRGAVGFQRLVAIKRMHPHVLDDPSLSAMFRDEARIAALVQHPNVVGIHDVAIEAFEHLIVMEYVDGVSLARLRNRLKTNGRWMPTKVGLRIVVDTLRGLHAAHELRDVDGAPLGVVHRDANPHNILLSNDGVVKIADFGIARLEERSASTATGNIKGKIAYMAPEQFTGAGVDRRCDLFAMAVVLWEMITGHRLFRAESDVAMICEITDGNYTRPSQIRNDIAKELDALVMGGLSVNPDQRHPSAAAFADAIEAFAQTHGGLASSSEVAQVVADACGEEIQVRRHRIHEILGGRAPKVSWGAPRVAAVGTGSHTPSLISLESDLLVTEDRPMPAAPAGPSMTRLAMWMGGGAGLAIIAAVVAWFALRSAPSSPTAVTPSASPANSSSAAVAPPSVAPLPDRVQVRIIADADVMEIKAAGVADVTIDAKTVTFTLPRSDKELAVHVRFADGTETDENVVPNANAVIRLRTVAKPTKPAGGKPGPGNAPPEPTLKYESNPYQ